MSDNKLIAFLRKIISSAKGPVFTSQAPEEYRYFTEWKEAPHPYRKGGEIIFGHIETDENGRNRAVFHEGGPFFTGFPSRPDDTPRPPNANGGKARQK
jgi:hypothetical protein